ncbi:MAG: ABC transporter ATP-binding protein, partial [Clostridia bacterium]|nr:ABC transporter ATP-binding protein [Clostridia bacterium]
MKKQKNQTALPFFGLGKVLPFLGKYRALALIMVACGLGGSVVDIVLPLYQRYALNNFVAAGHLNNLGYFIVIYLCTIALASLTTYIACSLAMKIEVSINKDLRNAAFAHLQTLSFSYFNQNSVGYIHARIMSDTSRIGSLLSWSLMDCVWHFSYLIGAIVVMLVINFKLALLVLTVIPIAVLLFSIFQKKLVSLNREIRETNSKITGNFNEGITGAKTIKTLVIEDKIAKDFVDDTKTMCKKSIHASRFRALFAVTISFTSSFALAIVLWRGGILAKEDVGTFAIFMSYAQGIMEPIRWVIDVISDLITTQVNIERLDTLLNTKSDVTDTPEVIEKYGDSFEPKRENWE